MILIIAGMPGSGKDIFVQEAAKAGFKHVRMGDMVRLFAGESGIGPDDRSIGGFASSQRDELGPDIWAKRTLERMPEGDVIIDGSRSLAEIGLFKARLGDDLKVIGIDAPEDIRFSRLKTRARPDDPSTREEFWARDRRELSWGLGQVLDNVDIRMINDTGLEGFREACRGILQDMVRDGKSL